MLIACMTVALHGATQTVVFDTDVQSGQYYRIPAIVQLHDGRLLAIADDRHGSDIDIGGNWGIDIVGRVSSDGGQTWEPPFMIADGDGRREGFRDSHGDAAVAVALRASRDSSVRRYRSPCVWADTSATTAAGRGVRRM